MIGGGNLPLVERRGFRTQARADIKIIGFSVCARSWRIASFVGAPQGSHLEALVNTKGIQTHMGSDPFCIGGA